MPDAAVIVKNGRITYAGPAAAAPAVPPDVIQIDAKSGTIMPGLVEAHFHPTYFNVSELADLDQRISAAKQAAKSKQPVEFGYHSQTELKQDSVKWVQLDLGASVPIDEEAGVIDRCVITSFQLGTVCEAVAAARPQKHVWLVLPQVQIDIGLANVIAAAKGAGVPMLGLRQNMLSAEVVAAVRAAGLGIGGWACNDAAAIERLLDLRVDVFTTDRPDLALAARARVNSAA